MNLINEIHTTFNTLKEQEEKLKDFIREMYDGIVINFVVTSTKGETNEKAVICGSGELNYWFENDKIKIEMELVVETSRSKNAIWVDIVTNEDDMPVYNDEAEALLVKSVSWDMEENYNWNPDAPFPTAKLINCIRKQ